MKKGKMIVGLVLALTLTSLVACKKDEKEACMKASGEYDKEAARDTMSYWANNPGTRPLHWWEIVVAQDSLVEVKRKERDKICEGLWR